MPSYTSRLQLKKPAGTETVKVADLNDNFDRIDLYGSNFVCTSTTRPTGTNRFTGLSIFETDTNRSYIWNGATWLPVSNGTGQSHFRQMTGTNFSGTIPNNTNTTVGGGWSAGGGDPANSSISYSAGILTVSEPGLYLASTTITFASNAAGSREVFFNLPGVGSGSGRGHALPTASQDCQVSFSQIAQMAAGDTCQVVVAQNSGGALAWGSAQSLQSFFLARISS